MDSLALLHVTQQIKTVLQGHAVLNRMLQKVATNLAAAKLDKREKMALWERLRVEYEQLERSRRPDRIQAKRKKARVRAERNRVRKITASEVPLLERYGKGLNAIKNFSEALRKISMLEGIGRVEFRQKIGRIKTEAKRIPSDPVTYPERKRKRDIARLRRQIRRKR